MSLDEIFPKLVGATRAAAGLASNDVNFYKSLDQSINAQSEEASERLLKLINQVVSSDDPDSNDIDSNTVKESWSVVSNALDSFLEKADIAFDELANGKKKNENGLTYLDDSSSISSGTTHKRQDKPQLKFRIPVDNTETHPFKPKLAAKPNSILPFDQVFNLTEDQENDPSHYKQPYETEILQQEYNPLVLEKSEPITFKDWEETDAIWVDTIEEVTKMVEQLKNATEIAVDLEHHDYRSYYGIVCLMQISTRDQDWLIDTIALRDDLQALNTVFTNPLITKVFHGAFMDIIWLQRDLGLYIVSLFDTYHASRLLGFPKHSLAYLLERFAQFKTSKKYQLADWRIRPLTKPMRLYARSDTHFLLFIYDQLKNMLLESNKMDKVLFESRNVAIRRFEYSSFRPKIQNSSVVSPIEKSEPWKSLLYQYNLSQSRSKVVEALYTWRDQTARLEDESPRFVIPNQLLVSLASLAPTDAAGVLASSNVISESVRKNCKIVGDIIKDALKVAEIEDFKLYDATAQTTKEKPSSVSVENVLKDENRYRVLLDKLELKEVDHITFHSESTLFSSAMIDGPSRVFNSSHDGNIPNDLNERGSIIEVKLNQIKGTHLTEESDVQIQDATEEQVPAEVKEEENKPSMFDEKDDIVVLRTKKHQTSQRQAKDQSDNETKEAFDYTKADKVIQQPSRYQQAKKEKADKKRSSNTFDPYSLESEGPRPAKKQSKPRPGKTASFVQKKKK